MTHEKSAVQPISQTSTIKIRVDHIVEMFTDRSTGDLDTGERADSLITEAQIPNKIHLIPKNLRLGGWKSDIYKITHEVDPHAYDQKVGISQRTQDTYMSTEVVTDNTGRKGLISWALTTKLRDEVRTILGNPQQNEENNLRQFPTPQPQEEKQAV